MNYTFVVLTNAVEGREDEYNEWYDDVHLDDVLAVPGFVAAQRFTRVDPTGENPFGHLALYEIETDDIEATMQRLTDVAGTDAMFLSEAMDREQLKTYLYAATGIRKTAPVKA